MSSVDERPDAPVLEGCDLRGMPYMPLDVIRLFDSDFYALSSGDEFKAGLSLWCKAFLQTPAGSLPSNDKLLAHLSGAGHKWKVVKEMALHGWFECKDGRLYHKVVFEKVADAWKARVDRRARTEAARATRQAARDAEAAKNGGSDNGGAPPVTVIETKQETQAATFSVTEIAAMSVTDTATGSKLIQGNEDKKEREESTPLPPRGRVRALATLQDDDFSAFYAAYPKKVAPDDAFKAWRQVTKAGAKPADIMAGLARFQFNKVRQFIKEPAGWLRAGHWKSEQDGPPEPAVEGTWDWVKHLNPTHQSSSEQPDFLEGQIDEPGTFH